VPSALPMLSTHRRLELQIVVLVNGEGELHSGELAAARHLFLSLLADLSRTYRLNALTARKPGHGFVGHVAELVRAQQKGHVSGHRYTLTDNSAGTPLCTSTPAVKLSTATSTSAQAVASQLWCDAQQHMEGCEEQRQAVHEEVKVLGNGAANTDDEQSPSQAAAGGSPQQCAEVGDRGVACSATERRQNPNPMASPLAHYGDEAEKDRAEGQKSRCPWGSARMEIAAYTPGKKWVVANWALGCEFLHIADSAATRSSTTLATATRNALSMLDNNFPGVMGM
jgi:hypothetical protein